MSKHTEYQTIEHCGHPVFVLVPWNEWNRIKPLLDAERACSSGIPQDVVEAHVLRNEPLVKAWREHFGITQAELAARLDVSQAAIAKYERPNARLRTSTVNKIAAACGLMQGSLRKRYEKIIKNLGISRLDTGGLQLVFCGGSLA